MWMQLHDARKNTVGFTYNTVVRAEFDKRCLAIQDVRVEEDLNEEVDEKQSDLHEKQY